MMSPEMNRWQMALANSSQCAGFLVATETIIALNDSMDRQYYNHAVGRMCCLGVCLAANGADAEIFKKEKMPCGEYYEDNYMPIEVDLQGILAAINDYYISHRIIREILIDFAITGDPNEIIIFISRYKKNTRARYTRAKNKAARLAE